MGGGAPLPPPPPPSVMNGSPSPPPPPPPFMGSPPPPPGPPGMLAPPMAALVPTGPKPSVKMRGMAWSKVANPAAASVWRALDAPPVDLNIKELEDLFVAAAPAAAPSAPAGSPTRSGSDAKNHKLSLIDTKRAYNLNIMLSRIKITFLDMKHGIETGKLDDSQLLSSILANVPTAEDEVALQDFIGGSPENLAILDRADQFLAMLIPIPRLKSRLEAMIFALKLKERLSETTAKVEAIAAACRDLESNMALKKTLRVVLQVGNFMNSGSFRGNAQRFNIDFLMRVRR
ncbi:hypothetical protein AMAG_17861 [Allomyces macrogynus ATCC 38327]|uniref:FH2 domain-containing protein n=1 Tax=Allomyces macrogynus (strain ATCC 38327) TaxID=578462 RepID=A0A0L0S0G4_ALLM3|nr:hypothetical protein AMAG_17861 [Allomyces macrogynus ATCC 38327]|eukprot:KNE56028.1 hypothetical protein AMAG_17861 [Allomyces macrogynus ATCC 38327]